MVEGIIIINSLFRILLLVTLLIGAIILFVLALYNIDSRPYCFIFEHDSWKNWRYFLKIKDKFQYEGSGSEVYKDTHLFNCCIDGKKYVACAWKNGYVSIHDNDGIYGCLATRTCREYSKKMYAELIKKLPKEQEDGQ